MKNKTIYPFRIIHWEKVSYFVVTYCFIILINIMYTHIYTLELSITQEYTLIN